ncbi:MAG: hypothetical protein ABWK53_02920 [Anaerolineales bacterium]
MLAPVTHILPLTTIRRERLLPLPGRVVARLEQKVSPVDVIAEAVMGQEHVLYDIARTFGVSPEAADKMMRVSNNETVQRGQVIAQSAGLVPRSFRADRDGRVVAVGGGQVLLEVGGGTIELYAGLPGTVTRLIPERGAEITFSGALLQGVWGNGRVDTGLMLPLLSQPDEVLKPGRLDVSLRGSVLLAGHCGEAAVLQAAAELPVRGLILASMSPALIPLALQMRYPIIVMDGFGRQAMNAVAFKLLATNVKRETTLCADPYDRHLGTRPEILIPLPAAQEPPPPRDIEAFAPNQRVRLCRAPHLGEAATLLNLLPGLTILPSGIRVPAAEVKLESGEQIVVPLANLEILG